MLDDLVELSKAYESEEQEMRRRGHQSLLHKAIRWSRSADSLLGVSYRDSETSQRHESMLRSSRNPYSQAPHTQVHYSQPTNPSTYYPTTQYPESYYSGGGPRRANAPASYPQDPSRSLQDAYPPYIPKERKG